MGEDSITVEILKSIRDELRETKVEIRGLREGQDRTNERLDRVIHEQIRHATAIVELEGRMVEVAQRVQLLGEGMNAMARELHGLNDRIDNVLTGPVGSTVRATSERVDLLEARVQRLEAREG